MSVIVVQYGQCGNQTGQSLFSSIYEDIKCDTSKTGVNKSLNSEYVTEAVNKWFYINERKGWEARSILVDTEDKVTAAANNSFYKFRNVVAKPHGGSANNWAFGYMQKSIPLLGQVMECFRKEVEKCDFLTSVLNILSSGGGTGSGVGTKIIEALRDEYPNKTMANAVVLPYNNGEVVTQNYNTLLTLAKLYRKTETTFLFENDTLHQMCNRLLSITDVTFDDINSLMAQQLAAVLQPASDVSLPRLVANLTSHPSYRFAQFRSVPHTREEIVKYEITNSWPTLINQIRSCLKSSRGNSKVKISRNANIKLKCAGNFLITRGGPQPIEKDIKPLQDPLIYVPWLPTQVRLTHCHNARGFKSLHKFATLSSNNNSFCDKLDLILDDAWTLFTNGAYLHHYKKFDVDEEYFLSAFHELESVLQDYNSL